MRAERKYLYKTLKCLAETFTEYSLALLDEGCPEEAMVCLTVSYGEISDEYRRIKLMLTGKEDLPKMSMFIRKDGKFDNYAFHTMKMLYQSNTAARGSTAMLDELVYAGSVIKKYLGLHT